MSFILYSFGTQGISNTCYLGWKFSTKGDKDVWTQRRGVSVVRACGCGRARGGPRYNRPGLEKSIRSVFARIAAVSSGFVIWTPRW